LKRTRREKQVPRRARSPFRRAASGFLIVVLALAVGAGGVSYLWLRSSLPQTKGQLVLPGLAAEVTVTRDAHGIPTITAQNDRDAAYALGFLHAQDRLYAMDLMRRYGAGRLSEWFGAAALPIDRFTRTLGLYRAAQQQYAGLSPELRAVFDAYAAGVNAFLAARRGALPPEYYLVGGAPEPWTAADSLVWGKIMDLQLTGNFRGELQRLRMLQRISPGDLDVLYPSYPDDAPLPSGERALLDRLPVDALAAALPPGADVPERASNNWAVSGRRSQSGKPIIANDTHLDYSSPGTWYLARIKTPTLDLAGVTAPGAPFVVIGHSDRIAWAFTTTTGDVEDLFIEKPDPADPDRYLAPGGSLPFDVRQEEIQVRDGKPVSFTIRSTRHGPVISDLAGLNAPGGEMLALDATWLGDDDRTPEAIWRLGRAANWGEFVAALKDWVAPQQNILYADSAGHIGFFAPARVPIRAKGDGWLPAPGWSGDYDWTGYIPFGDLPSAFDPPSQRLVTANNRIVPKNYGYFLSRDWDLPNRAERIAALLDRDPMQSPETAAAIQGDTVSLMAHELLPLMLLTVPSDPRARAAMDRLLAWDGSMDRDKPEPLIFSAWLRELNRALFADKLGPYFADYWSLRPEAVRAVLTSHPDWCGAGGCGSALSQSLDRALDDLSSRYGSDPGVWRWGKAHYAAFEHPLWSKLPQLRDWLTPVIAADGGIDTVNAGAFFVGDDDAPFADRHGPVMRMIVDMAEPDAARFMVVPGQSGNPLSRHWDDLLSSWRDLDYVRFGGDTSGGTLVLTPP
jgi:penicillin G amidase